MKTQIFIRTLFILALVAILILVSGCSVDYPL